MIPALTRPASNVHRRASGVQDAADAVVANVDQEQEHLIPSIEID
jgi:hypothetical protein